MRRTTTLAACTLLALAAAPGAWAQTAKSTAEATAQGIAEYREMLADGNPAELFEAKGEELWKQARGPKKATLERCDLGLGPGVVKGAFVQLPRYFADTGRVEDLESRLVSCMVSLQGYQAEDIVEDDFRKAEKGDVEAMATWIAGQSRGMRFNLPQGHAAERRAYALGKQAFYFRGGTHDFSCASCHGEDGKRVRLQELPNLTQNPGDGIGFAAWPAYRVGNGQMWSMQHRLNDCYRQQRFPYPGYISEVTIALATYMGVNAKGAESIAPALKR